MFSTPPPSRTTGERVYSRLINIARRKHNTALSPHEIPRLRQLAVRRSNLPRPGTLSFCRWIYRDPETMDSQGRAQRAPMKTAPEARVLEVASLPVNSHSFLRPEERCSHVMHTIHGDAEHALATPPRRRDSENFHKSPCKIPPRNHAFPVLRNHGFWRLVQGRAQRAPQ